MAESTCLRNMYRINHPAGFRWKIALFLIGGLLVSNNASILTFLFFCIHWPEELWFLPLGSSSPHSVKSPCVCAKSLQLYPTLCDPMDHSPPGSSVHRILQSPYPSQFFTCAPAQPVKLVQNNGQHKTHPSNIQLGFTYVQIHISLCPEGFSSKSVCALSCLTLCNPMDCSLPGYSVHPWDFLGTGEYWSVLPCPPPGDLPDPGMEPASLKSFELAGRFFTTSATWWGKKWQAN